MKISLISIIYLVYVSCACLRLPYGEGVAQTNKRTTADVNDLHNQRYTHKNTIYKCIHLCACVCVCVSVCNRYTRCARVFVWERKGNRRQKVQLVYTQKKLRVLVYAKRNMQNRMQTIYIHTHINTHVLHIFTFAWQRNNYRYQVTKSTKYLEEQNENKTEKQQNKH